VNGPVPATATLKVTLAPAKFVWLVGWVVIVGAGCAWRLEAHQINTLVTKASGLSTGFFVFISTRSAAGIKVGFLSRSKSNGSS
jgi:hypothetical protein